MNHLPNQCERNAWHYAFLKCRTGFSTTDVSKNDAKQEQHEINSR